jgi:hypothetical protein
MQPVNMQARLDAVIPEEKGFAVQKCKCKMKRPNGREPADMSVDIVVKDPADLPSCGAQLTRVKNVSLTELAKITTYHTAGLILDKSITATPEEKQALVEAWKVEKLFDLSGPKTKAEVKGSKLEFQSKNSTGDLNKVVINPKSEETKKAKITFSADYLKTLLDIAKKKEKPFDQVNSWKFCLDFRHVKKYVWTQLLARIRTGDMQKVKASDKKNKNIFYKYQKASFEAAIAKAKKAKKEPSSV